MGEMGRGETVTEAGRVKGGGAGGGEFPFARAGRALRWEKIARGGMTMDPRWNVTPKSVHVLFFLVVGD